MYYDGYHLLGMHLIWWFFWGSLVFWVFATPYYVPGQQKKRGSALDVLQRRYASGEIKSEEYIAMKKTLENA